MSDLSRDSVQATRAMLESDLTSMSADLKRLEQLVVTTREAIAKTLGGINTIDHILANCEATPAEATAEAAAHEHPGEVVAEYRSDDMAVAA